MIPCHLCMHCVTPDPLPLDRAAARVEAVKLGLAPAANIAPEHQILIYKGDKLDDARLLADYGLPDVRARWLLNCGLAAPRVRGLRAGEAVD